ncbi:hypothetical protein [Sphingorhabdus sp. Alg239-R122]|uniref:hypothetical protein n=1 Tax=Sphingorhabdus sp. Alg239-R122 TaxID=2305989 RepID=UPI0013DD3DA9|nr:hypothetical protein [Sphingorhabdus sp. Alg239-R122]
MEQVTSYGAVQSLHDTTCAEMRVITSFRLAAAAGKAGQDPAMHIAQRLGSYSLSSQLSLIVSAIGDAWPDNFMLSRPCCPRLTFDEVTVIAMLRSAGAGNRAVFDELLRDMLPGETRDFLYGLLGRFAAELETAPRQSAA